MRAVRAFRVAALAGLAAMALVAASSASADFDTALCSADEGGELLCAEENQATHVHFVDSEARLLTNTAIPSIQCNVLFLGEALVLAEAPAAQLIHGNFTATGCNAGCTAVEVAGPGTLGGVLLVLKVGEGVAEVRGNGFEVRLMCTGVIQCHYTGDNLVGEGLGANLPEHAGTVHINDQTVNRLLAGPLDICPSNAQLDLLFETLEDLFLKS